jgi:hypothetical protein
MFEYLITVPTNAKELEENISSYPDHYWIQDISHNLRYNSEPVKKDGMQLSFSCILFGEKVELELLYEKEVSSKEIEELFKEDIIAYCHYINNLIKDMKQSRVPNIPCILIDDTFYVEAGERVQKFVQLKIVDMELFEVSQW